MSDKPAVLLSDELVSLLEEKAISKASYEELTGTQFPWEITFNIIKQIQEKIDRIESNLRSSNPGLDITCIVAGEGIFWLNPEGLGQFQEEMKKNAEEASQDGPMPVWKLTAGEIFKSHISNMRRLILAVCHDIILLRQLQESFGENHQFIKREFERYERFVRILTEDMKEHGPNLNFALSEDIIMLERAEITERMLENKTLSKEKLGYSPEVLKRVIEVLDKRCKSEMPTYRKRLLAIYNQMQNALREGETTQLTRASRWEFAFGLMGEPPIGYRGQAETASMERQSMQTIVESREKELGESEKGRDSLKAAQEAESGQLEEPPKEAKQEPEPEQTPEPPPEEEPQSKKKKSPLRRMAFTTRRKS
ncbi:hypothetical protein GF373_11845 [bacterium]|nr:hypothetical protein [bacterium]